MCRVTGVWNKATAVAIKTLKPGTMPPAEFLKEAAIMKRLHHPRLVALYAVCSTDEPILIVTELMSGGSLLNCLLNDKGRTITWNKLIDVAAQVGSTRVTSLCATFINAWFRLQLNTSLVLSYNCDHHICHVAVLAGLFSDLCETCGANSAFHHSGE